MLSILYIYISNFEVFKLQYKWAYPYATEHNFATIRVTILINRIAGAGVAIVAAPAILAGVGFGGAGKSLNRYYIQKLYSLI